MTTLFPHETVNAATNAVAALENLTVLSLTMPVWSGTKVMTPSELNAAGGTALPTTLVTNGGKKVIDPKQLNVFSALRRQAHRLLGSQGVAFAGGAYAIPNNLADAIMQKLELIINEYEHARDDFLANYDKYVEEWIAQNPGYEALLRAGVLTQAEVEKKFGAYYTTLKLSTSTPRDRERADQVVEDLGSKALDEVSKDAADYARSILTKSEVSRRGLNRIRLLRDKLYGLGFLSSAITPVVRLIDNVLGKIPMKGDLQGSVASEWKALIMLLANREMLGQFANGEIAFQASAFTLPSGQPAARPTDTDERSLAFNFDEAKTEEPSDSAPAPEDDDFDLDDFDDASDVPGGQASTFEVADVPTGVLNVPSNIAPVPSEQPATMGSFFF